jgi:hypothetical protein
MGDGRWLLMSALFWSAGCSDAVAPPTQSSGARSEDAVHTPPTDDTSGDSLAPDDTPAPRAMVDAAASRPMTDAARTPVVLLPEASLGAGEPTHDAGHAPVDGGDSAALDGGPPTSTIDPPFQATGAPIAARDGVWTYVEFPASKCRDGSPAGVSVRLNSASKKVLIYLEGGVYCFDALTCAINPTNVNDTLFNSAKTAPSTGIFDLNNHENPVRDWNVVYVPYCTGDAMGGTKTVPTDVPGGPSQQWFVGHLNLQAFLSRIVPTFRAASDVVLTGMSAGGSSVLMNVLLVQRAFPSLKVRFINDSSLPPVSKALFPECLQNKLRTLWGLEQSLLAACGDSCPNHDDYWQDFSLFLAKRLADRPAGFLDAVEDSMMRAVLGVGARGCRGTLLFDSVAAAPYRAELLAYRDKLAPFPRFSTFYPEGTQHTWLKDDSFYKGEAGQVRLVEWFAKILNGEVPGHAGP